MVVLSVRLQHLEQQLAKVILVLLLALARVNPAHSEPSEQKKHHYRQLQSKIEDLEYIRLPQLGNLAREAAGSW